MENKNNISKRIEAYEEGTLSAAEKQSFENELKTNEALAKAWQLHQEVDQAIEDVQAMEMETLLQDIGNEFAQKYQTTSPSKIKTKGAIRPIYRWVTAASLILLFSFLWWQFGSSSKVDAPALYAEVYEPYSATLSVRSTDAVLKNGFETGQEKYQTGDYANAISLFTQVLANDSLTTEDRTAARFYKGLAHLGQKDMVAAQKELSQVLAQSPHLYTQQAQWYVALIALQNNELDTARSWLQQTIKTSPTGKYARQATILLARLE